MSKVLRVIQERAEAVRRRRDEEDEATFRMIEEKVIPELVRLLNKAQRKLKWTIRFIAGNGTQAFFFDDGLEKLHGRSRWMNLNDAFHYRIEWVYYGSGQKKREIMPLYGEDDRRYKLYRERFPELVEFVELIEWAEEDCGYVVGEIKATVPPKYSGHRRGKRPKKEK